MITLFKESSYTIKQSDHNQLVLHKRPTRVIFELSWSFLIIPIILFILPQEDFQALIEDIKNSSELSLTDFIPYIIIASTIVFFIINLFKHGKLLINPQIVFDKRKNYLKVHGKIHQILSDIKEVRIREINNNDGLDYKTSLVISDGQRIWLSTGNEKDENVKLATVIADFLEIKVIISS